MLEAMLFNGPAWGGRFTVQPARTSAGRLLIGCRNPDSGREFCITISRWISERRTGRIKPGSGKFSPGYVNASHQRFLDRE